ncbi:MAG: hypothetical protein IJ324_05150 [Lachnospiraceae bacterium]|nr:hypothetical protein [Lachnospiraceae bacterium]
MSKKREFRVNVGTSSILLIFVVLCLVAFATLSIVSANADYKLSRKVADRTSAYYEAANQAEKYIASIDKTLQSVYATAENEEAYFTTVGYSKSYLVPISDLQSLSIKLDILYPTTDDAPFYRLTSWQVITTGELEYENTYNFITIED